MSSSDKQATAESTQAVRPQPLISFSLPCYNSASYMDTCVQSILDGSENHREEIEIILVNDGSDKDDTAAKADQWARDYPDLIRVFHQENGGHGEAVNTGMAHACGIWFKVVDSDDWLDVDALRTLLDQLHRLHYTKQEVDMVIVNYVYEKIADDKRKAIRYTKVFPRGRIFGWSEVGRFAPWQNLLMHSVVYRTELLRSIGLRLPRKTFYVDNVFAYVPLPAVKTMLYLDIDLYRYYIGREGQSVDEQAMIRRVEQQLLVTRTMIDAFHLMEDVSEKQLRAYMVQYLSMMMAISAIILRLSKREDAEDLRRSLWAYLKEHDPGIYSRIRGSLLGMTTSMPGPGGSALAISGYRVTQKIFAFN